MPNAKELSNRILAGGWDGALKKLYGASYMAQRKRYAEALEGFAQVFGAQREVRIYSAPGRTEIGGNHTDHNRGVVMAAAVDLDIIAVAACNADNVIRVKSKGFSGWSWTQRPERPVIIKTGSRLLTRFFRVICPKRRRHR